jgi:hypothetical protein
MATRSNGMEDRCFLNLMGKSQSLCFPPIQPHITGPPESETRQSPNDLGHSFLDDSTLVPSDSPVILQEPHTFAENGQNVDPPVRQRSCSSTSQIPTTNRMDCVRRQYQAKGFSAKSAEIHSNSCRSKTSKQYQSSWNGNFGWAGVTAGTWIRFQFLS